MMTQMGLNQADINQINALNGMNKANVFSQKTATAQFSGTVNGRTFNMRTGADGTDFNGSFDSSINVRGGYNVNMGSALAGAGWASGGVTGMRAVGMVQTGYEGITGTLNVATDFIPGGSGLKKVKNLAKAMGKGKGGGKGNEGMNGNGGVSGDAGPTN